MKRKTAIKLLSVITALTLILSIFAGISLTTSAATTPVTYMDFEDGVNPFYLNKTNAASASTVTTLSDGNTALNITTGMVNQCNSNAPYGKYTMVGGGLKSDGDYWTATARPTRVSFKFKAGTSHATSTLDTLAFFPIWQSGSLNYFTSGVNISTWHNYVQVTPSYKCLYNPEEDAKITLGGNALTKNDRACVFETGDTLADSADKWNSLTCDYDWSNFTEENNFELSYVITVTDYAGNYVKIEDTVVWRDKTEASISDSFVTKLDDSIGYSFGIRGGANVGTNAYSVIDDICVWSYDIADSEKTYAPTPIVKALGATMAVEETEAKDINVKVGFDLTLAEEIAILNGETVTNYGALLKAGTVSAADMRAELTSALENGVSEGFVLKKRSTEDTPLPDIYQVTVTNSGETANMGKRLSAIGYIITDKGNVYISANNSTSNGITDGVINKSTVGLLKNIFAKVYIPAYETDATALNTAISEYNTANSTGYTADNIKALVNSSEITTDAEKALLKALHFALNG